MTPGGAERIVGGARDRTWVSLVQGKIPPSCTSGSKINKNRDTMVGHRDGTYLGLPVYLVTLKGTLGLISWVQQRLNTLKNQTPATSARTREARRALPFVATAHTATEHQGTAQTCPQLRGILGAS